MLHCTWVCSISKQLAIACQTACLIQNAPTSTPTERRDQHHLTTWQSPYQQWFSGTQENGVRAVVLL